MPFVVRLLPFSICTRAAPICQSHSQFSRQFLDMMDKPDLDSIEGLSPAISIQQKSTSKNPRSTVGTTLMRYTTMCKALCACGQDGLITCGERIQMAVAICS